jgi:hypothetical protein
VRRRINTNDTSTHIEAVKHREREREERDVQELVVLRVEVVVPPAPVLGDFVNAGTLQVQVHVHVHVYTGCETASASRDEHKQRCSVRVGLSGG